jgi:hypothetical protein
MTQSILPLLVLALVLVPSVARATPQPLPFTYVYETLPKGGLEVEQYADYTTVKAVDGNSGDIHSYGATQFQTEFEYGITDRLELGLYVTFEPGPGTFEQVPVLTEGDGIKERLRLRLAEAGQWPVDVGLYGELVENEREVELEAKVILQRRAGNLRVVANLWGEFEHEFTNDEDWVINPTVGATYQVTPSFHPGVESWLHDEFSSAARSGSAFNLRPQVYVGPTTMVNFGNLWWSTGLYLRVTEFGRALTPGVDSFGSVWARMIIGLSL